MIVHICCSVDSHIFLKNLRKDYPSENITGFFYNPNIHPYSEYKLRLLDVKHSCSKLDIELIEGDYNYDLWLESVSGLENEPEKGDRCTVCFDNRLDETINKALEFNHESFTTTLLMSPLKSQERLKVLGESLSKKNNLSFVYKNYKSGQDTSWHSQEIKDNNIYRQNYCGCMFALNTQRKNQDKLCDELLSQIGSQVLPESIEQRIELYEKRNKLDVEKKDYRIVKNRFLNYRLLAACVSVKKEIIPSYFICYSTLPNSKKSKGKIEFSKNDIYYFAKNEIKFIKLDFFNKSNNTNYKSVKELMYSPISFEKEQSFRNSILNNFYDLSCLIVLDEIPEEKMEIFCDGLTYEDIKEFIVE